MKVVFFGTPSFVDPVLKALQTNFDVVSVFRSPEHLNNKAIAELRNSNPDLFVVASFGKILSDEVLSIPKHGALNIHPSLLPKYRGPSPIQTTIINGYKKTGVTIIKMDEEVDHGPIIYQETLDLSDIDNFDTLSKKMFLRASEVLPKVITDFISGKIKLMSQDDTKATYCSILSRESGYFDIQNPPSPEKLDKMIRAYYPWPGVWTRWNNKIVKFYPDGKIQMEGKKVLPLKDFLNGYPDFPLKCM